jgi:hypothetical protein
MLRLPPRFVIPCGILVAGSTLFLITCPNSTLVSLHCGLHVRDLAYTCCEAQHCRKTHRQPKGECDTNWRSQELSGKTTCLCSEKPDR